MPANGFAGSRSLNARFLVFCEDLADDLVEVGRDVIDFFFWETERPVLARIFAYHQAF